MKLAKFHSLTDWYTFQLKDGKFFMGIHKYQSLVDWNSADARECRNVKNCIAIYINLIGKE